MRSVFCTKQFTWLMGRANNTRHLLCASWLPGTVLSPLWVLFLLTSVSWVKKHRLKGLSDLPKSHRQEVFRWDMGRWDEAPQRRPVASESMGVQLLGPVLSGNADLLGDSAWCSQRGKTPFNHSHGARFPWIIMGLGLHAFQSRDGEAAALGSWRVPCEVASAHLSLSLSPVRHTGHTRR